MSKLSPEATVHEFVTAINGGDAETALALYEPNGILVGQPGQVAVGTEQLREALNAIAALKPTITTEKEEVLVNGDIALYMSNWSMTGTAPDGSAVNDRGKSSDVFHRQPDGSWLIAIDNPRGSEILG